ncbi:MAG: NTP transferase domain-containing protein, partial [Deltaproteobacteria bacterium]|nr:NTP transferase domain-containing protein [Deltaproteobacteria bacterium]
MGRAKAPVAAAGQRDGRWAQVSLTRVEGLVLAAGHSSRAGGPKALARLDGRTLLARAVETLRAGGCAEVTVVVGAAPGAHTNELEAVASGARVVRNEAVDRGMLWSLQLGLRAAQPRAPDAVVVSLVDHPHVTADTVRALLGRLGGAALARPTLRGERGHPFVLGAQALDPVLAAAAAGRDVVTVEGLAPLHRKAGGQGVDPVQDAFDKSGALQCGF